MYVDVRDVTKKGEDKKMKKETIIKKDSDRKTEINRVVVNVPETKEELFSWKKSDDMTEMEKYVFDRIFQDWEKGRDVSIQSKLDSRKKGLDEGTKKIVNGYKNASEDIKKITDKILRNETLTKEEMIFLTKKQMKESGFGK